MFLPNQEFFKKEGLDNSVLSVFADIDLEELQFSQQRIIFYSLLNYRLKKTNNLDDIENIQDGLKLFDVIS